MINWELQTKSNGSYRNLFHRLTQQRLHQRSLERLKLLIDVKRKVCNLDLV